MRKASFRPMACRLLASLALVIAGTGPLAQAQNPGTFEEFENDRKDLEISVPGFLPADIDWDRIINGDSGDKIDYGVRLMGPSPYDRNADTMFIPASNVKLFTAGAMLEYLGADFRYVSHWRWDDLSVDDGTEIGNLRLIGSGDPSWGSAWAGESIEDRVKLLVSYLEQSGIRKIHGPIRIEATDSRWSKLEYPQGWEELDYTACYAALAQAVNLDGNCGEYVVTAKNRGHWSDPAVTIPVELDIRPGRATMLKVEAKEVDGAVGMAFRVHGTFRRRGPARKLYLPVHDSASRLRNLLTETLEKSSIEYLPRSPMEAQGLEKEIAVESEPLHVLLKRFLKDSDNLVGHSFLNTLGERLGPRKVPSLLTAGQAVLRAYIAGLGGRTALLMGVPPESGFYNEQVVIHDGSGISRDNRVTPEAVMTLLQDLASRHDFGRVWEALAIAGVDGTLRHRMRGSDAEGVLRGKTGTVRGVYNLAGYVPQFNALGIPESFVPFVILSKTESIHREKARAAQDRTGAALTRVVNSLPDAFLQLPFNFLGGM